MKNYLAVFLGKPEAMDAWRTMPEAERKQKEQAGIEAWHKWVSDNEKRSLKWVHHSVRQSARTRTVFLIRAMNWARGRL